MCKATFWDLASEHGVSTITVLECSSFFIDSGRVQGKLIAGAFGRKRTNDENRYFT